MSTVGSKTITVSLTKNGGTCTDDITINVIEDHHNYFNGVCTGCGSYEPPELKDGVYQIKNYANLYWFAALVNGTLTDGTAKNTSANAVLVNDITVNSIANMGNYLEWTPIGNSDNRYEGTFDGQGHKIIGLYFNDASADYVGLFGYLLYGTIRNVGVVGSYFNGKNSVGGVCGHSYGTIENCYNTSTANGVSNVGGIVGVNFGGEIRNCYNTGAISASNYGAGGIAGYNYYATIMNCYSSAAISAPTDVGGICGASDYGTVNNCYHNSKYFKGASVGRYVESTLENVSAKTATQFTSGEVAYLLSNGVTDGTQVWYQTLGTDGCPTFDNTHGTVYYNVYYPGCVGAPGTPTYKYENIERATELPPHNFVDGICTICGAEQHIVIIEADMHAEGLVLGANTVADCKAELNTAEMYVVIKNMNGEALTNTDLVGTGATITYYDRTTNEVVKTVTVVLYGDVNGDGLCDNADYTILKDASNANAKLDNQWFVTAADITRDGAYDAYDAIALDLFLHGYMAIPQKFV
ncbi:MAG: dockerin type I repeat-containing protein, partial [Candidatus Fimenecus sp.]